MFCQLLIYLTKYITIEIIKVTSFDKCLTSVQFPKSLVAIGDVYFPVNTAVKKYTLNEGIEYLGKLAFDTNVQFGGDNFFEMYRQLKTEFAISNDLIQTYVEQKFPIWEQEWAVFIENVEVSIEDYKRQGAPYEHLEEYLKHLQNK